MRNMDRRGSKRGLLVKQLVKKNHTAINYLPIDPNGAGYPPTLYINEPQIGPSKNPIPVAISISPILYSLSLYFDVETVRAIDATAFTPEPSPPIIYPANETHKKMYAPSMNETVFLWDKLLSH